MVPNNINIKNKTLEQDDSMDPNTPYSCYPKNIFDPFVFFCSPLLNYPPANEKGQLMKNPSESPTTPEHTSTETNIGTK